MRQLTNNLVRHMTHEEQEAILKIEKIIEEAFKTKVNQAFINATREDPMRAGGLNFIFDLYEVRK